MTLYFNVRQIQVQNMQRQHKKRKVTTSMASMHTSTDRRSGLPDNFPKKKPKENQENAKHIFERNIRKNEHFLIK